MIDKLAQSIATDAHKYQKRLDGTPYINHPKRVADRLIYPTNKAIAWLHDVLEDTDYTAQDLLDKGISKEVVDVVVLLTRKYNQSYYEFILGLLHNERAIIVKLADIEDNLIDNTNKDLVDKYLLSKHILRGRLFNGTFQEKI